MGRPGYYPTYIEQLKSISTTALKKLGYLESYIHINNRAINWINKYGEKVGAISVSIKTNEEDGFIILDYTYNETQKINYKIQLIAKPSNLGKGLLWYFVCPETGKVCRKLYLYNGYFLHTTAFKNLYYEKQLRSRKIVEWDKKFGLLLDDDIYMQRYKKNFKTHYKGKPTKKYLKLTKLIEAREQINIHEYEMSFFL
ncbi:hypothetical protein CMT52_08955 [Elizabethkingia anophelis]|nr:hypothetical protein [Elizabethkingia anophelis]MDV4024462.1 hypothetical protein [Elizabethkingia anophelis]